MVSADINLDVAVFGNNPPRSLTDAFRRTFPGQSPDVVVRSPGRVNLLGGHVDLHEGTILSMTIDRGVWLAAAYGSADLVNLCAADLDARATLSLTRLGEKKDVVGDDLPRWVQYPAGVAWALQQRGLKINGMNAVFLGNLPMRAGLSSSAAVEMAFAVAWQSLENWQIGAAGLAKVGREAERDYMLLGTGVQDQFTCLHGRAGHAVWLDCRSLDHQLLAFPEDVRIVVCDTSTRRELVRSSYNDRAGDAHAAVKTIKLVDEHVRSLRDVSQERLEDFRDILTDDQYLRARHVVTEIARVQSGFEALNAGSLEAFGCLMNESYWSARNDYGSSSAALDAMWQATAQHPACYGARYSGGGEAGAIVALVNSAAVDDFIKHTAALYAQTSGCDGNLFVVEPVHGAGVFQ